MEQLEIIATIRKCVQIGPEDFELKVLTKRFDYDSSLDHVDQWAKSHGLDIPSVQFSLLEV